MNYTGKIDLAKVKGAFSCTIQGKTTSKKCICIPLEEGGVYAGEKGVYLNFVAWEAKERKYEDTHFIKPSLTKEQLSEMNEEERKSVPIIGGMHELQTQPASVSDAEQNEVRATDDDLPF